jgi:hypothetical protein
VLRFADADREHWVGILTRHGAAASVTPYRDDAAWRIAIGSRDLGGALDGDVVVVEPLRGGRSPRGRVLEVLGPPGAPEADFRAVSGDLVEFDATPYAGDAYFNDWPSTLDALAALQPQKLVPGRGPALQTPEQVRSGLAGTRGFVAELYASVKAGAAEGRELREVYKQTVDKLRPKYGQWVIFDHCMPFDVTRAYDEATEYADPRIWTAERDKQMWAALEG